MERLLYTENEEEMDAYVQSSVLELGRVYNMVQSIRESDEIRKRLKRAICIIDMHCVHYKDLRVGSIEERTFFSAIHPFVDKYVWGLISSSTLVDAAREIHKKTVRPCEFVYLAKRIAYSHALRVFDTAFLTKLVETAVSTSTKHQTLETTPEEPIS
jgi:hypothetical protein